MNIGPLLKFWPLMHSIIQEFWGITEQYIEKAAAQNDIPIELYLYSELGLHTFSTEDFQRRDPFSNPEQFEKNFALLNMKGWIEPLPDGDFQVTDEAREGVRKLIQAGDAHLLDFGALPASDLERLADLLKQVIAESKITPEPPEKWAIFKRFRIANDQSPLIVQIREYLMDMYAYRDDSHLSAARPYFNEAGIVWLVLGALWKGNAVNAEKMAENMPFRGYEEEDYDIAIQAAMEIGWAEPAERADTFRLTQKGKELREEVERLTNEYFYTPWSVLMQEEIEQLYDLLTTLRHELGVYRKTK
jgi:hypothetical protein